MPTLPITASASAFPVTTGIINPAGTGSYNDSGTASVAYGLMPIVAASATTVEIVSTTCNDISATVPITWANGDKFVLDFRYEI